ncbi:hypothetical protein VAR608DRAFT_2491 [Variovorax sp. HW608]|uniref:hypothetical protein n=1 Tax=Variovorax sp. HW608 TaxID=1034889 RepID=UPI00081FB65B|nr:hypothetical protein [Variovorax sp. HW608]SCK29615.1 hypothetical protein VAR608DRAFT_2491 [Variovorax sp. HW608]
MFLLDAVLRSAKLLLAWSLLSAVFGCQAATGSLVDLEQRLKDILDGGVSTASRRDEAVAVLRAMNQIAITASETDAAGAIEQCLRASITKSAGDIVASEARIVLSGIGYGDAALTAYSNAIVTIRESEARTQAASIVEEKSRGSREKLPIAIIAEVFRGTAIDAAPLPSRPAPWFYPLSKIVASQPIGGNPLIEVAMLDVIRSSVNVEVLGWIGVNGVLLPPTFDLETMVDMANDNAMAFNQAVAKVGRSCNVCSPSLELPSVRFGIATSVLMNNMRPGAEGKSLWDRIPDGNPAVKQSQRGKILNLAIMMLEDRRQWYPVWRAAKGFNTFMTLSETELVPFVRRIAADPDASALKPAISRFISVTLVGERALWEQIYNSIP